MSAMFLIIGSSMTGPPHVGASYADDCLPNACAYGASPYSKRHAARTRGCRTLA
jgi:hypothetical protein